MSWTSIPADRIEEMKRRIIQKPCLLLCSGTNGGQIAALTALLDDYSHETGRYLLEVGQENCR